MQQTVKDLGRVVAVHPVAAAYQQRAVFIALLSFLFFLGMMFAFYLRQSMLYFLLSTAFLIVYLVTMFSWLRIRRNAVTIYENGLGLKRQKLMWTELRSLERSADGGLKLNTINDGTLIISPSYQELERIAAFASSRLSKVN